MARFKILWRILTLRCEEASRLCSDSLDRRLGRSDRVAMALHLISCGPCRRFRRQLLDLRRISERMANHPAPPSPTLPEDARERIRESLKGG